MICPNRAWSDREEVGEEILSSYKCRSKLVHGNELAGWSLPAVVEQTRKHLRLALLRVIEDEVLFDARAWGNAGADP